MKNKEGVYNICMLVHMHACTYVYVCVRAQIKSKFQYSNIF